MRRARFAVAVLAAALPLMAGAQAAPHLADYQADIVFSSPTQAGVTVAMRTEGAGGPVRLLLATHAGETLDAITVADPGGTPIAAQVREEDGIVRIDGITASAFELRYRVSANDGLRRVPLVTPGVAPLPQQRPVAVRVTLPPGHTAVANSFPALQWADAEHGSVSLAAVPSVVVLRVAPSGSVTLTDRLLTPEALSTTAMFGLLLLGSVFWIVRNRRPRAA